MDNQKLARVIRNTTTRLDAALRDIEAEQENKEVVHQQITVANVNLREIAQLTKIVRRVIEEIMPAVYELEQMIDQQLSHQEAIEGHVYEEMLQFKTFAHEVRNLATVSQNLPALLEPGDEQ